MSDIEGTETTVIVVVRTAGRGFGLPAAVVERVFAAVEITPIPEAPAAVAGAINIHGAILPVIDLRQRLGYGPSPPSLSAKLVVVQGPVRPLALLVEAVDRLVELPRQAIAGMAELVPGARLLDGIAAVSQQLIFLYDVAAFLSPGDNHSLEAALGRLAP